jgi:hypothetical protein
VSTCTPEKFFKKYTEKTKQNIIVFDSTKMPVGNKNDEERGTHFCFFSDITEEKLENSQKK